MKNVKIFINGKFFYNVATFNEAVFLVERMFDIDLGINTVKIVGNRYVGFYFNTFIKGHLLYKDGKVIEDTLGDSKIENYIRENGIPSKETI